MILGFPGRAVLLLVLLALVPVHGATVSRQNAEVFARKIGQIQRHGTAPDRPGTLRTPLTEDEVNSWFAYTAAPLLPPGVTQPRVAIVGGGRLAGEAVVDLEAVAKRRSSGGSLDPWSLIGGRVPVSVTGTLQARDGVGRFNIESATISGVPVPAALVQEILSYYSRTPERPQGVRLDSPFALPANIRQIEVGRGQAVVVQ
ncbi:MAG: hypothetical protein HY657_04570 [Acidobacteria bacterium]|nr:hypothetical protein [Acidobacteriota bacterium]